MRQLLKLHRNYLFSKKNTILIIVLLFVLVLGFLWSLKITDNQNHQILFSEDYQKSCEYQTLTIVRVMSVLLSSYLFCHCFIKNNGYSVILNIRRTYFFITKIMTIGWVMFVIILFLLLTYIFEASIFTKWYFFDYHLIINFLKIYELSLIYGFLTFFISYLFNSSFGFCLVFGIFMTMEIIKESNVNLNFLKILFPIIEKSNNTIASLSSHIHLIVLCFFYFLLSIVVYNQNELYA